MKFKSIISMALLAVTVLFTACNEDGYWDKQNEEGSAYSFAQATANFSYLATDAVSQISVNVFRNNTNGAATLPITAEVSSDVLTAPESVSFADGSNVAEYVIAVNGELTIGETYSVALAMAEESVSASGNAACAISLIKDYTWQSAGACMFYSNWAGVKAKLAIQKAAEYDGNYYRIVSPYYYLEPSYCPNPGYHFYFYLDENYDPLALPTWTDIGEDGWYFYWNPSNATYGPYCTFYREENVYYMTGIWAEGNTPTYTAKEFFQWTDGWPLAE